MFGLDDGRNLIIVLDTSNPALSPHTSHPYFDQGGSKYANLVGDKLHCGELA